MSTKNNPLFESPPPAIDHRHLPFIPFFPGDSSMRNHESQPMTAIAAESPAVISLDTNPPPVAQPVGELSQLAGGAWDRVNGSTDAKAETERPLIDVKEFAAKLGCCPKHIRRMADAGRCPPPIQLGGLRRWKRQVVDDWIAAGCPVVRHVRIGGRK